MATIKRIEIKTPHGRVALVRTRAGRFGHYRVSYQWGNEHWCEYCAGQTGPHALKSFRDLVRYQRGAY